jgi:alpha-beta hydrolase superfamily lysophospholipase
MTTDSFILPRDGVSLFIHRFLPSDGKEPTAIVQIAHGMAEHAARYERFAGALTSAGYAVYANDHRGHGRTAADADLGHFGDEDGWGKMVGDLCALADHLRATHPGKKLYLFAHSMGSFLALDALVHRGAANGSGRWDKVVLSGSDAPGGALPAAGRQAAKLERLRQGKRGKSALLSFLSFGSFNGPFKPARTPFDWLSRDPLEVDKYVADPHCGFRVTNQSWVDFLGGLIAIGKDGYGGVRPKTLPILIFSGQRDPVGKAGEGVKKLVEQLRDGGLTEVTERLYPEGRHEMLNETNRDEVTRDVLAFLAR